MRRVRLPGEGRRGYRGGVVQGRGLGNITKTDKYYPSGYSIHEVGTYRMGDNPKTSVLNNCNQSHDVKNLVVVDGDCFVACGWQTPTMTISALSMAASEHMAELLKQGEV